MLRDRRMLRDRHMLMNRRMLMSRHMTRDRRKLESSCLEGMCRSGAPSP